MALAFVFPGQGSQSLGMLAALAEGSPVIQDTFAEASDALGYDLWARCQSGPAELLNSTECTQPAMLTAGIATYRLWRERGGAAPAMMAGHSLGEFSALVAAGYLDFRDAVAAVRYRGELMQSAVPAGAGAMAAVLGLEDSAVEALCHQAAQGEVVEAVNFNAPGQVVIAGGSAAVNRAVALANAQGGKCRLLPVSVPAHSSLMQPAALKLRERLDGMDIQGPLNIAVYGVEGRVHQGADDIRHGLVRQLYTPVYWAATVRSMISSGATVLIECGPNKVLTGLNRRIDRNRDLKMLALENPAAVDEALGLVKS